MSVISHMKQHPRGFWFVFWGELAERSSYYGMRTLLALYLVTAEVLRSKASSNSKAPRAA